MTLLRDVAGLLWPRGCAGCDRPDEVLCARCRALMSMTVERPLAGREGAASASCGVYRGPVRHAILSWKDHDDAECDGPFAVLLADLAVRCGAADGGAPLTLVPAPSSTASMRRRGRAHMRDLTSRTARELRRRGYDARCVPLLRNGAVGGKSVETTGASQRGERIRGRIGVATAATGLEGRVFLTDDIVTTGSTLRQCVAALDAAGIVVSGALTLASVPERGDADTADGAFAADTTMP
ncbi:ComF family protein [Bifidobacterium samirii]|uniref:Phosphoribosyl transferase n=1 Tax=Bifidobacterium samirii TaxID=2306974 RepID=A0A430FUI3_9BIFI|nr:ComF family protein [Bifidobacterium samirii]RSX56969.1 phosphoribosyl transferase [Bifidobacterium samirii]